MCDTKKIRAAIKRSKRFIPKVFDKREIKYCMARKNYILHLAGRFAAKEAFIKAVATGKMLNFRDIVVLNGSHGEPFIELNKTVKEAMFRKKAKKVTLSLSHIDDVSAAVCVFE